MQGWGAGQRGFLVVVTRGGSAGAKTGNWPGGGWWGEGGPFHIRGGQGDRKNPPGVGVGRGRLFDFRNGGRGAGRGRFRAHPCFLHRPAFPHTWRLDRRVRRGLSQKFFAIVFFSGKKRKGGGHCSLSMGSSEGRIPPSVQLRPRGINALFCFTKGGAGANRGRGRGFGFPPGDGFRVPNLARPARPPNLRNGNGPGSAKDGGGPVKLVIGPRSNGGGAGQSLILPRDGKRDAGRGRGLIFLKYDLRAGGGTFSLGAGFSDIVPLCGSIPRTPKGGNGARSEGF